MLKYGSHWTMVRTNLYRMDTRIYLFFCDEADDRETLGRLKLGDVGLGLADVHSRAAVLVSLRQCLELNIPF
jgi:hypothetical protein